MRTDDVVADRVRGLLARHGDAAPPDGAPPDGAPPDGAPPDGAPAAGARRAVRVGFVRQVQARIAARVPVRVDPGRRAAWAVGAAVLIAAIVTGAWLLAARPRALAVSSGSPTISGASPQSTRSPSAGSAAPVSAGGADGIDPSPVSAPDLVVDVAGKVVRPGLYHLAAGSRVADALTAAGGARPGVDLTTVNLAAPVADGQQIVVGLPPGAGASPAGGVSAPVAGGAGASGDGTAATPTAPVDLNTATIDQLETLPGIGPAMGQRILDWRAAHGSFRSIDQLNDVSGIGDVKFAALKALVTV